MITDLLWFLGAKQQHDMQKGQGLAGLMGILLVLFLVWQWNNLFYPLVEKLGLVSFAERTGLIHEDLAVITVLNIVALLFFIAVFFSLILILFVILGTIIMWLGLSERGQKIIVIPLTILFGPFLLIMLYSQRPKGVFPTPEHAYKRDRALKPLIRQYKDAEPNFRMFRYYVEQVESSEEKNCIEFVFGKENAKKVLNRAVASIMEDREWLVSYDLDTKQYCILFPNPLPEFASAAFACNPCYENQYGSLYDFERIGAARLFEENEYIVPAFPISFEWTGTEMTPMMADKVPAMVKFKVNKGIIAFKIKTKAMSDLYDKVAQFSHVQRYIKESHLAIYLIPIAHPISPLSTSTRAFIDELATIPFTDTYAPIYAADVQERMVEFAQCGRPFAIEWFKSSV